jgi:hypothetical protein
VNRYRMLRRPFMLEVVGVMVAPAASRGVPDVRQSGGLGGSRTCKWAQAIPMPISASKRWSMQYMTHTWLWHAPKAWDVKDGRRVELQSSAIALEAPMQLCSGSVGCGRAT